jgi:hypothetical protein
MDIIKIDSVTPTSNGIDVAGTYDAGSEDVNAVHVCYRLNNQNKGRITGIKAGPEQVFRVTSNNHKLHTGDRITVFGVLGTEGANGDWWVRVVSQDVFDLRNSQHTGTYTSNGEWFLTSAIESRAEIPGEPPPTPWSTSINLVRRGFYDVRAVLFWTGSPNSISTAPVSINVY